MATEVNRRDFLTTLGVTVGAGLGATAASLPIVVSNETHQFVGRAGFSFSPESARAPPRSAPRPGGIWRPGPIGPG